MEKKKNSDFRYNTGFAKVPWPAVGEHYNSNDVFNVLEFLMRPQIGKEKLYKEQIKKVKDEIKKLGKISSPQGKLTLGEQVRNLEEEVKTYLKAKNALFLTNATAGFQIAYKFAGLKPEDEVIVPAITFIATMVYPLEIGAKIVIADVDKRTLNMDPEDVKRKITPKTKVIMPVHIGGYPVDMEPIMKLAKKNNITVIEDAAHAFGAIYNNKMVGTIGDFGAYSFHEVKNITSFGEGGILVSNNKFGEYFSLTRFLGLDLAHKIPNWLYDVIAIPDKDGGYFAAGNHSTTEIQALGLRKQLKRVEQIIAKRRQSAEFLNSKLKNEKGIILPLLDSSKIKSTHHLYLLQIDPEIVGDNVQVLKKKLNDRGVINIPHFGPLYKFSILKQLGYDTKQIEDTCPNTEDVFINRFTHLPLYGITKQQLLYAANAIIESVKEMKAGR